MAVAFDAAGPTNQGSASSPYSFTHTPSGTPSDALVWVTDPQGTTNHITSVTYGGSAMSLLKYQTSGTASAGGITLWYLANPPSGAQTVQVTWTAPGTNKSTAASMTLTGGGAHGTAASAANSPPTTSVSVAVSGTSAGGQVVAGACNGSGGTYSGTNSVTLRATSAGDTNTAADNACSGNVASAGGSQTVGFSSTATADNWGIVAVEIQSGGSAVVSQPPTASKSRMLHHKGERRQQMQQVFPPVISVTATNAGAGSLNGMALTVKVLTGWSAIGTTTSSGSVTVPQLSITPAGTGSKVYGAAFVASTSTAITPNGSTTMDQNTSDGTNTTVYGTFHTTGTTTASTPVTVGGSAPSVSAGNLGMCLCEIRTSSTLVESATAPASLGTTTAKTLTTAPFAPPQGALLVAMVVADGSGSATAGQDSLTTITDTGGLAWTKQIDQTLNPSGGILQVASIWTAVVGNTGLSVNAGLATATGSPLDIIEGMAVGLAPGLATGTGAAQDAQPSIGVNAGLAGATGAAQTSGIGLTPGLATGTGTAQTPMNGLSSAAGLASGTGAANAPNLGLSPGLSSGTGAAQAVGGGLTSDLSTGAGAAKFAGTALAPGLSSSTGSSLAPATGLTTGLATGTGSALDFGQGMGTGLTPGLATGIGAGLDAVPQGPLPPPGPPTLTTKNYSQLRHHHGMWRQQIQPVFVPQFTVTAGLATATGTAPGSSIGLTPGLATGTGAANTPGTGLTSGLAAGTGASQTPGTGLTTSLASSTGAAQAVGGGRTTGLATGSGAAQFAGTGRTPGLAAGTGTAQNPTASTTARTNVDYTGSTLANPNNLSAVLSVLTFDGTLSVAANTLGGTLSVASNNLGGTCAVGTLDGTLSVTSDTRTGTLNVVANTLSATEVTDKMQEVDITLNEFNDATVTFQIKNNGSPMDITGMTVNALFKKTRGDLDSAGTTKTYSSGGGSPAITINTPSTGSCTLAIPDGDITSGSVWSFYRIDVVNGTVTTTAIFGVVTITLL